MLFFWAGNFFVGLRNRGKQQCKQYFALLWRFAEKCPFEDSIMGVVPYANVKAMARSTQACWISSHGRSGSRLGGGWFFFEEWGITLRCVHIACAVRDRENHENHENHTQRGENVDTSVSRNFEQPKWGMRGGRNYQLEWWEMLKNCSDKFGCKEQYELYHHDWFRECNKIW